MFARSRSSSTSDLTASTCTTLVGTSWSGLTSSASRSFPSSTKTRPIPSALATAIDIELRRRRNPSRAPAEKAYLKSDLEFLGVDLPAMRQTVRAIKRRHGGLGRQG